jgi:hypothetical protein
LKQALVVGIHICTHQANFFIWGVPEHPTIGSGEVRG